MAQYANPNHFGAPLDENQYMEQEEDGYEMDAVYENEENFEAERNVVGRSGADWRQQKRSIEQFMPR